MAFNGLDIAGKNKLLSGRKVLPFLLLNASTNVFALPF
jgi:hypothetical protein